MQLSGKVALVTGGGSGIGRAAALGLMADGARVIAAGRSEGKLHETLALAHGGLRIVPCDVTEFADVQQMFAGIQAQEGPVDILINAAGIYRQSSLADADMAVWASMVNTNLTGAAHTISCALPAMLEQDFGRIVSLGSRSAFQPGAVTSAYSASKAGLIALTQSIAHELVWQRRLRANVQANVLIPGQTATHLIDAQADYGSIGQSPAEVYPFIRRLLVTSRFAGSGKIVYRRQVLSRGDWRLQAKQLRANLRSFMDRTE